MRSAATILLFAIACAAPAAVQAAHSGVVRRNGYSWSDAAIFLIVAGALWLAQHAMRRRARKPRSRHED